MNEIPLDIVTQATGGRLVGGGGSVSGVSIDSRTVRQGELFVPIIAERDGHEFAADAVRNGAVAVVCDEAHFGGLGLPEDAPTVVVQDTLAALWDLARWWRSCFDVPVVAVTGSNGKTTTKDMIALALLSTRRVAATSGTRNNHLGLPLTVLGFTDETQAAVVEIGANHPGEIAKLCTIAQPTAGVITNVAPAHLEGFGCVDDVLGAKWELVEALAPDAPLFFCGDDERLVMKARSVGRSAVTFGTSAGCHVRAMSVVREGFRTVFVVDGTLVSLSLPGEHNVRNALAAWAVARHFGVPPATIASALATFEPTGDRSRAMLTGGVLVFDDAYNANPESMKLSLATFADLAEDRRGRRVAILGEMLELGDESAEHHREAGKRAAEAGITDLFAVGEMAGFIVEGATGAGLDSARAVVVSDADEAAERALSLLAEGDSFFVKGSMATGVSSAVETVISSLRSR